jgi:hypothetical protein
LPSQHHRLRGGGTKPQFGLVLWGLSAGIDFGSGAATPIVSAMDGRGSCASIADINGELLFYAATMRPYSNFSPFSTFVFDMNNVVMQNGDSIVGRAWYQELVIIPSPANDSTYYLFSISVTEVITGWFTALLT